MLNRRQVVAGIAVGGILIWGVPAEAITKRMYDQKAFDAAQAAGRSILVEVHASWCPVCKRQRPILAKLGKESRFKNMVSFEIDFDTQKDLLRKFNVQKQSTLIAFKGRREVARSTGDTNPQSIEQLLATSF
jgi:thiol-disulfide isomerase/thioredoxin